MGGFLAELFLSRRPRTLDSDDSKECRWSRKLEYFGWRWLFAVSGSLTYCVGLWLWINIRTGLLDPIVFFRVFCRVAGCIHRGRVELFCTDPKPTKPGRRGGALIHSRHCPSGAGIQCGQCVRPLVNTVITVRALCTVVVLALANGQPAFGQQESTWRGALADLDNFESIIDLSNREAARNEFREVLDSPEVRHEIVAIHAYTPSEACENAAILSRIANKYGALVLTYNDTGEKTGFHREWFNRLDSACDPEQAGAIADLVGSQERDIANQLFEATYGKEKSGGMKAVYTTAPLPLADRAAELLGRCRVGANFSPPSRGTACHHYLSYSFAEKHQEFLNRSSASAEDLATDGFLRFLPSEGIAVTPDQERP